MASEQIGYRGAADATSGGHPYNETLFLIHQVLAEISTAKLVRVQAVTNAGDVSPVGFVDVLPLVNQLDGERNAVPHGIVHNIPYFRLQGGANGVILDPQEGDIGLCVFADRDISAVKAAKAVANPGSMRRFDMADGLYIGGYLNGVPQQYIQFNSSGISVVSPNNVTVNAGGNVTVNATGTATVNAAAAVIKAATIKLQNAGTALLSLLNSAFSVWAANHVHTDPQGGTTSAPTVAPPASSQTSVVQAE